MKEFSWLLNQLNLFLPTPIILYNFESMNKPKQDLWEFARRAVEQRDLKTAEALGFERCNQCGEWFHRQGDDMVDCAGWGRPIRLRSL